MSSRAHVIFHGKVQGVFFRANTQRKAIELGVIGWVRNLPDRTVEATFEGNKEKIQELISWCQNNQPYAKVKDIDLTWDVCRNEFDKFEIRY